MSETINERWEKLGRVFDPSAWALPDWWESHAALPTPLRINDDTIRVYVAAWDEEQRGRVGYVDVAANDPRFVRRVSQEPVLDLGEPGTFDEHGVNPSSMVMWRGKLHMFYIGWQRLQGIRYTLFTGVARSLDPAGSTFERVSQAPFLDRVGGERYVRTAPVAMNIGPRIRLWYSGGDEWIDVDGKETPTYTLRTAEVPTVVERNPSSTEVLSLADDEIGIGRPAIEHENGNLRMWYSARTREGYRIRYAEASQKNPLFDRVDGPVIEPSTGSINWDSEMVCFPATFEVDGRLYAFYNGNDYGRTGFGLARLEVSDA